MNQRNQQSEQPSELDEYNSYMAIKYKNRVQNGELKIINTKKLTNLQFLSEFKIHKLELRKCYNIIPVLKSSTIKDMSVRNSMVQNVDGFWLENLENLNVSENKQLENCSFERFKKLKQLDISETNRSDISNLKLPLLRILTLRRNKAIDLSSLHCLENLEELDLSYNITVYINPLQHLKQLQILKLSYCNLKSVQTLEPLTNLVELDVSGNKNIDLQLLKYLVNLKKLNISKTKTYKIDDLQPLNNLEELNISYNEIANINVLKYFLNLSNLNLTETKIQNIEILQFEQLKEFNISNYPEIDFQPVQKMVLLQKLSLCGNMLENISFLEGLINLEHLNLFNNENLADITPLQYLVNLTNLDISLCEINNFSSLQTLVNLEVLDITGNKINNIQHLKDLVKLTSLNISLNSVQDISVLKKFKCLKQLCLGGNKGVDITPLQYLTQLTFLDAYECELYEISALRTLVNLEYLNISENYIFYFYPIRDLDVEVFSIDNLNIFESSDFFTFFDVQDKSEFINNQPINQQIVRSAGLMKTVDSSTKFIRNINLRRKKYKSQIQILKDTVVSLQEMQHEILLSLSNKAVQLFKLLDKQEECQ
ncbi:Conserved_hypothetical protein [Hexamita inflata]|uniref:Chaoptin n=1 Tax=Hexamita inflata TaxID=28002 RepID=A0AA86RMS2_9EUKA|nr:Conserved hypothetical protein [Hexamita inflata]